MGNEAHPDRPARPAPVPVDEHGTTQAAEDDTATTSSGERTVHNDHPGEAPNAAAQRARRAALQLERANPQHAADPSD